MSDPDRFDERTAARERALDLLYEAHSKQLPVADVLSAQALDVSDEVRLLVEGTEATRERADELIAARSRGWTLERMPVIDRTVMRMATFELLSRLDVPRAVVLDEAVSMAKRYSTDDSGRFVNGVLAAIADEVRPG
ncbi:MAG: transcription antitermination factor NusB [Ilumatobacteraceae bacterium]|nr:transcription antitermination factor NusB [Actinomycetota bacterium]